MSGLILNDSQMKIYILSLLYICRCRDFGSIVSITFGCYMELYTCICMFELWSNKTFRPISLLNYYETQIININGKYQSGDVK